MSVPRLKTNSLLATGAGSHAGPDFLGVPSADMSGTSN